MELKLLNCTSDKRRLAKSYSTVATYQNVRLKENTSIVNPTFILSNQGTEPVDTSGGLVLLPKAFNYVRCDYLRRFYFVNDVRFCKGGLIEVDCHVDVLMTYSDYLLNHSACIVRCERKFFDEDRSKNGIFYDNKYPIRSDCTVESYEFGNVANNFAYYLTVNGGVQ